MEILLKHRITHKMGPIDIKGIVEELHRQNYDGYVRPDHGRHLWGEVCRPGYGLYDRALGIMYLLGLWDAYETKKNSGADTL